MCPSAGMIALAAQTFVPNCIRPRHLLNTKTEPHNEFLCKFLAWMTTRTEDNNMYIIVDRHIKDAFRHVYRTKKHIDRYGEYNMLYSLIEQRIFLSLI